MRKHVLFCFIAVLVIAFFTSSCKKDENPTPPSITLKTGSDYTPDLSVVAVGRPLKFGLTVTSGSANITNLVVKKIMPDGTWKVMLDSGLNSTSFIVNEVFYQNVENEARWTFQVMDKNRQFATTAMTIFKDPNSSWGGIFEYPAITLGYQNSTTSGQFLIPSAGRVYFNDTASMNQSLIDIVTYYFVDESLPSPTLSSPGELGGGITEYYPVIANWTNKNYTKWDISVDSNPIPTSVFDACHNDSLLIVSYNDVWGKRKFKWADSGKVIPFMTALGKKGLIKVISADHDAAGTMTVYLKMQQ